MKANTKVTVAGIAALAAVATLRECFFSHRSESVLTSVPIQPVAPPTRTPSFRDELASQSLPLRRDGEPAQYTILGHDLEIPSDKLQIGAPPFAALLKTRDGDTEEIIEFYFDESLAPGKVLLQRISLQDLSPTGNDDETKQRRGEMAPYSMQVMTLAVPMDLLRECINAPTLADFNMLMGSRGDAPGAPREGQLVPIEEQIELVPLTNGKRDWQKTFAVQEAPEGGWTFTPWRDVSRAAFQRRLNSGK